MDTNVKDGQTLADIAIQEFGSLDALADIAMINGMAMTEVPDAGTVLQLPDKVYDRVMQDYCKVNNVSPATARDLSGVRLSIFQSNLQNNSNDMARTISEIKKQ